MFSTKILKIGLDNDNCLYFDQELTKIKKSEIKTLLNRFNNLQNNKNIIFIIFFFLYNFEKYAGGAIFIVKKSKKYIHKFK